MPGPFADPSDVTPELAAARKAKYGRLGTGSFVADTIAGMSGKDRSQRYFDGTYDKLTRPLMNADEAAGAAIAKRAPWLRELMTRDELLPLATKGPGGGTMHVQRRVASAVEPLMKVKRFAVPVAAAMAVGGMLGDEAKAPTGHMTDEQLLQQLGLYYDDPAFRKMGAAPMPEQDPKTLMKEAAAHINTLSAQNRDAIEKLAAQQRRGDAESVVWDMVEQGHIPAPTSREEYETKIAGVVEHGADLTRRAMELAPKLPGFVLDKNASANGNGGLDPLSDFVING